MNFLLKIADTMSLEIIIVIGKLNAFNFTVEEVEPTLTPNIWCTQKMECYQFYAPEKLEVYAMMDLMIFRHKQLVIRYMGPQIW